MSGEIRLESESSVYQPDAAISGTVQWQLDKPAQSLELRLIYHTTGRGTQDVETVALETFSRPALSESRVFSLMPEAGCPWSFSGKLISVVWGLELVTDQEQLVAKCSLVVSPSGQEIDLYAHDDGSADADSKKLSMKMR